MIGKWAKDMEREFTEKETMIYKYTERCCLLLIIRELQRNSVYHFH